MEQILQMLATGANLPCAEMELLTPLKRSREYAAIRPQVADLKPLDAWQEDGVHYFVFALRPEVDDTSAPLALFSMASGDTTPMSAMLITPGATPEAVHVQNLRRGNGD